MYMKHYIHASSFYNEINIKHMFCKNLYNKYV